MKTIETTATVTEDGTLIVPVPPDISPGPHRVVLVIEAPEDTGEWDTEDLPEFDVGPWPKGLALRREEIYDDWGR